MSSFNVYTGPWVNYSLDGAGKPQWTLASLQGGFLLAAVAAYVTIVGSQFWGIASFIAHQIRAVPGPQDGIHHVRQVTYRNSSALRAAWVLFTASIAYSGRRAWYWPKRVDPPYSIRRNGHGYLAVLFPLLVWASFVAAAALSSLLTRQAYDYTEVLVEPQNCGFPMDLTATLDYKAYQRDKTARSQLALAYMNACYNNSGAFDCRTLPKQKLPYELYSTTYCPFGERCLTSSVVATTEWLDSHTHFGINAPSKNRVQIRKQTACAVVNVTDRINYVSDSKRYEYYLGPYIIDSESSYNYSALVYGGDYFSRYDLAALHHYSYSNESYWHPISDFNITDADVTVFIVRFGGISYLNPTNDPLFRANTEDDIGYYVPDSPAGLLACTDRWRVRDIDRNIFSRNAGFYEVVSQYKKLGFNSVQMATVGRLLMSIKASMVYDTVGDLGATALRAHRNITRKHIVELPDDQWLWEVVGLFELGLASLQQADVSYAYKAMDTSSDVIPALRNSPSSVNQALRDMCYNQKIRNVAEYQSFSLVGVATIFVVGAIIILVNLTQDTLLGLIPRMRPRLERWRTDSVLHLQRLAYQNAGQGQWERTRHSIPAVRGELDSADRDSDGTSYISVRGSFGKGSETVVETTIPPAYVSYVAGDTGYEAQRSGYY